MEFHLWLSLVVICILGALSPGPSLALVVKNTLNGGHSQGYATAVSHGLGVALYAAITATGIGIIIVQSPLLYAIIQYAGAAFHFPNDVHDFRFIGFGPTFINDGQIHFQAFCQGSSPDYTAYIWGYDDHVVVLLLFNVV